MSTESGPLRRFGRWVRQRPIRTALMGVMLFVVFVPVWPYQPHCGVYSSADFRTLEGDMTPEFLAAMDRAMWNTGVYHWRIGDTIYLRLLVAPLPDGDLDLHGDL